MQLRNVDDELIAAALTKLVSDGKGSTFVQLEPASPPPCSYYVQFAVQGGMLYCEAVSNAYLDPPCQLDDGHSEAFERLGWGPPEAQGPNWFRAFVERLGLRIKGRNWFRTFEPTSPQDYDEIVRLAHRAFCDVYRLPEDVPITMTTSWEATEPRPLVAAEQDRSKQAFRIGPGFLNDAFREATIGDRIAMTKTWQGQLYLDTKLSGEETINLLISGLAKLYKELWIARGNVGNPPELAAGDAPKGRNIGPSYLNKALREAGITDITMTKTRQGELYLDTKLSGAETIDQLISGLSKLYTELQIARREFENAPEER